MTTARLLFSPGTTTVVSGLDHSTAPIILAVCFALLYPSGPRTEEFESNWLAVAAVPFTLNRETWFHYLRSQIA